MPKAHMSASYGDNRGSKRKATSSASFSYRLGNKLPDNTRERFHLVVANKQLSKAAFTRMFLAEEPVSVIRPAIFDCNAKKTAKQFQLKDYLIRKHNRQRAGTIIRPKGTDSLGQKPSPCKIIASNPHKPQFVTVKGSGWEAVVWFNGQWGIR